MSFKEEYQRKVESTEEILRKYLPAREGYQKIITEAMEYSLMAGGKRIRPVLMREFYELFGGEGRLIEPFMAAIEMIRGLYCPDKPEVIFIGNTFSSTYFKQVEAYIQDKDVVLNVISKSGTTTETAMAFRMLKQLMENKYPAEECRQRILATTDRARGTEASGSQAEKPYPQENPLLPNRNRRQTRQHSAFP